jgi:hypothetical protein
MTILFLIILTLGLGVLDRYIGWGGHGRVKPVLASVAFLASFGYLLGWPILAWATLPVAFLIWRTPGWKTLGGSLAPTTKSEVFGTFCRHLLALAFVLPAYYAGVNIVGVVIAMVAFAIAATYLAVGNAKDFAKGEDHNAVVEVFRGFYLGFLLGAAILF